MADWSYAWSHTGSHPKSHIYVPHSEQVIRSVCNLMFRPSKQITLDMSGHYPKCRTCLAHEEAAQR